MGHPNLGDFSCNQGQAHQYPNHPGSKKHPDRVVVRSEPITVLLPIAAIKQRLAGRKLHLLRIELNRIIYRLDLKPVGHDKRGHQQASGAEEQCEGVPDIAEAVQELRAEH